MDVSWEGEHKGGSGVEIGVGGAIVREFESLCISATTKPKGAATTT